MIDDHIYVMEMEHKKLFWTITLMFHDTMFSGGLHTVQISNGVRGYQVAHDWYYPTDKTREQWKEAENKWRRTVRGGIISADLQYHPIHYEVNRHNNECGLTFRLYHERRVQGRFKVSKTKDGTLFTCKVKGMAWDDINSLLLLERIVL